MPDNMLLIGGLLLGAFFLFRPRTNAAASFSTAAQPMLPGLPPNITAGLAAASGDEDIGIHPVGGIAGPAAQPGVVLVENGNTPVIEQLPIFQVTGSNETGFQLIGQPVAGLTGDTQIRIVDSDRNFSFVTRPDVLAQELINQGPVIGASIPADQNFGGFLFQPENVDLDIGI